MILCFTVAGNHFPLVANGVPCPIYIDSSEDKGVMIAAGNLQQDIQQVCGKKPELLTSTSSKRCIIAGTYGTPFIKKLMSAGKIDKKELDGKNEKYILQVIANPCEGIDEAVVIIGATDAALFMVSTSFLNRWEYLPGIGGQMFPS